MDVLAEIWRRAVSVQPVPAASTVVLTAALALVLVCAPTLWPLTRLVVTLTHEGAHAVTALLVGRRLQGIRLHSDTSGLTLSHGRTTGVGMVATLLAGYLGPAVVGVTAALALGAGHGLGLLWGYVGVLALMLLQMRNFYGLAVVLVAGATLAAVSWYLTAPLQSTVAYLTTWVLLFAAPKPVLELIRQRRRGRGSRSDADQLGRLTGVAGGVWATVFLLANLAGLILGAGLLLPALAALAARVMDGVGR